MAAQVILRRYSANSYEDALDSFESELQSLAVQGWFPTAQSWGWDAVTSVGFIFGGSSWRPGRGTLAVTYRRDESPTVDYRDPER
jgi:hypothetical protein